MSDEYDYTEDELSDLYNRIADDFPYEYDDNGEPLELGRIFDILINVFTSNKLIEFAE